MNEEGATISSIMKISAFKARAAAQRCNNRSLSDDYSQEIAAHIVAKLPMFSPKCGSFSTWVNKVATRKAADIVESYYRKKNMIINRAKQLPKE